MDNQLEKFVLEFFSNLKCKVVKEKDYFMIDKMPKSFEDVLGKKSPVKISFSRGDEDFEFVGKGSRMLNVINKYLEGAGKATLLKIDFDVDPIEEIRKVISLKDCEVNNITKKHTNNSFSRFTFKTIFQYMNETDQTVNEIYIHDGKIVKGDLSGYKIIEGETKEASISHLESDYNLAREELKELIKEKTAQIGNLLKEKVEKEVERIKSHYDIQLKELGGDLNQSLEKINELEVQLRVAEDNESEVIRTKLERLKKNLLKISNDDSKDKILKEQDFTIKDVMHKHSLNIENKLINTTVIYYPVFKFTLFIKGDGTPRYLEMTYNPLTRELNKVLCESCNKEIKEINLCSSGHITCEKCLGKCGECHKKFCKKCLKRSCTVCGKLLCKDCSITCLTCGSYVCRSHLRKDCVSGEERCTNCLRACLRCHGLAAPKYFFESVDGSKVCQRCMGEENRRKALKGVFGD